MAGALNVWGQIVCNLLLHVTRGTLSGHAHAQAVAFGALAVFYFDQTSPYVPEPSTLNPEP